MSIETNGKLARGLRWHADNFYRLIDEQIAAIAPGFSPYLALFGCSDEVNAATDHCRYVEFGKLGGFFTTRMIGSQVFFDQINVAVSRGHSSNIFEVNVHIGEMGSNGNPVFGELIGRDGAIRHCCGAMSSILKDFESWPHEMPTVSKTVDGELYLDFLGTLKFRLKPRIEEILAASNRILAITLVNLDVQTKELIRQLRKYLAAGVSKPPLFLIGTISYNHIDREDDESLEFFFQLNGPEPADTVDLLC